MNKSKISIIIILYFLFIFINSVYSVTWTGENCAESPDYNYIILYVRENNSMITGQYPTVGVDTNLNTDIIYVNGLPAECSQYNVSVGSSTTQNYYCLNKISASDYSNSNSCLNNTIYNLSLTSSSNYFCLRDYNKTAVSRVNITLDGLGSHRLRICHLDTFDMFISGISYFPETPILNNDLYIRFDNSVGSNLSFLRLYNPSGTIIKQTAQLEYKTLDGEILITGSSLTETGIYRFNLTSCQLGNFLNVSTWANCSSCNGWFNTTNTDYDCISGVGTTYYVENLTGTGNAPVISNIVIKPDIICRGDTITFAWNTDVTSDAKIKFYYNGLENAPITRENIPTGVNEGISHSFNISSAFVTSTGTYFYDAKSCYNSVSPYQYLCSNVTSTLNISDCDVQKPISDEVGDLFANLGIGSQAGLYLFSIILSLAFTLGVLFWTKRMDFGIMVFITFLTMFAFIGWLPFWLIILEVVIAGLFIVTKLRNVVSGDN